MSEQIHPVTVGSCFQGHKVDQIFWKDGSGLHVPWFGMGQKALRYEPAMVFISEEEEFLRTGLVSETTATTGLPPTNSLEAAMKIYAERQSQYGDPAPVYNRVAKLWSGILGVEVTARQVIFCMMQVKIARELSRHNPDSIVDIAGFVRCLDNMPLE